MQDIIFVCAVIRQIEKPQIGAPIVPILEKKKKTDFEFPVCRKYLLRLETSAADKTVTQNTDCKSCEGQEWEGGLGAEGGGVHCKVCASVAQHNHLYSTTQTNYFFFFKFSR